MFRATLGCQPGVEAFFGDLQDDHANTGKGQHRFHPGRDDRRARLDRCARDAEPVCVPNMCWATVALEVEVNGRRGRPRGSGLSEFDSADGWKAAMMELADFAVWRRM
jgi:hypothetical protein